MSDQPSVLIVIADMGSGGAQQVVSNLANHWAAAGIRVGVVTWTRQERDFFKLDKTIERIALTDFGKAGNALQGLLNNARRVRELRGAMRRFADATILSFIAPTNVLAIIAATGLGRRVVISERNDPARQSFGRVWDRLRRSLYGRANLVTANSYDAVETLGSYVVSDRLTYLPNPLRSIDKFAAGASRRGNLFLSVGRLHTQKAFDVLIAAFAQIADALPNWRLSILGEGGERRRLQDIIDLYGLGDRVTLEGQVEDPFGWYARAGVFVLPSRYEGSPNALLEAMASATPSIISDAVPDHARLSGNGVRAQVVEVGNVKALAAAMKSLASDNKRRTSLGTEASKFAAAQTIGAVAPHWNKAVWPDIRVKSETPR